jgi:hypothetical protein
VKIAREREKERRRNKSDETKQTRSRPAALLPLLPHSHNNGRERRPDGTRWWLARRPRSPPQRYELHLQLERVRREFFEFLLQIGKGVSGRKGRRTEREGITDLDDGKEALEHPFTGASRTESVPEDGPHLRFPEDLEEL